MEIKLSEFEVEKLKEIVIYFLEVPRKLWKQHYDYVNDLRTINLSVDLSLNDAQQDKGYTGWQKSVKLITWDATVNKNLYRKILIFLLLPL